jgi:hypothetical protein
MNVRWLRLGEPLLCRLGFHKWRNYGDQVMVSWKEPHALHYAENRSYSKYTPSSPPPPEGELEVELDGAFSTRSEAVYEGRECKRCGMKLRRKFVTNSDGTLSCVGWEAGTEETNKE